MLLYRLCKEEEIKNILKTENISSIGKYCRNMHKLNNHKYQKNKKYLHFFLDEYEITNLNPKIGKYICTYDIPKEIVDNYMGIGYYRSQFDLESLNEIPECAIPTEIIDFSYLLKIEKLTKTIDFEDYFENESTFKEEIYTKNIIKNKRRIYGKKSRI